MTIETITTRVGVAERLAQLFSGQRRTPTPKQIEDYLDVTKSGKMTESAADVYYPSDEDVDAKDI